MGNKPARCLKTLKMMSSENPIVVVMGATGTGKSKLAIELAKRFNGEIISVDSMQVYKGLDIVTNKVTPEELREVPHHMMSFVDPLDSYTVTNFFSDAMPIICRLHDQKKLPILVGGTHYYIESILWDMLVAKPVSIEKTGQTTLGSDVKEESGRMKRNAISSRSSSEERCSAERPPIFPCVTDLLKEQITPYSFPCIGDKHLHECLKVIDPATASTLHPRNRRKVIRALQVFQQHGRPMSKILAEQNAPTGGSSPGGRVRFPNAILIWIQTDMTVLEKRLDDRVDDMMSQGLMDELMNFHREYNAVNANSDEPKYTEGIFQSIGFKEFHKFLTLPDNTADQSVALFEESVQCMKTSTRQLAKKQIKWINNRLLRRKNRQVPPVYAVDSTFVHQWETEVYQPAVAIVEARLRGEVPLQPPLPSLDSLEDDPSQSHFCETCQILLVGKNTINAHNKSKKHWRNVTKLKKYGELSSILTSLQKLMATDDEPTSPSLKNHSSS